MARCMRLALGNDCSMPGIVGIAVQPIAESTRAHQRRPANAARTKFATGVATGPERDQSSTASGNILGRLTPLLAL